MANSKKETRLNNSYSELFSEDQAIDIFIYLTNKNRGKHTSESNLRKCYRNNTLGTLLKRQDPIAYNCAE